jgi:hypothetical protein
VSFFEHRHICKYTVRKYTMARVESLIFESDQGSTAPDVLAPWPPHPAQNIDPRLAADGIAAAFQGQRPLHPISQQSGQDLVRTHLMRTEPLAVCQPCLLATSNHLVLIQHLHPQQFQLNEFQPGPYNYGNKDVMASDSRTPSPSMTMKREDTPSPVFSTSTSHSPTYKRHITPHSIASSGSIPRSSGLKNEGEPSFEPKEAASAQRRRPRQPSSPPETASTPNSNDGRASPGSSSRDATNERRSRNRIAATKSRRRKKQADEELADQEHALRSRNRQLVADAAELRDQVLELKNQILSHGACDSPLIKDYLANEARRFM